MSFNPEMLILARESRELTQAELADLCSVAQSTISKVESGLLLPEETLVDRFAEILKYTSSLFLQNDKVYGFNSTIFFHRKRKGLSERILRRLHAQTNLTRMRIARLLRSINVTADIPFIQMEIAEFSEGASGVANLLRSTWLLPPGPIRNVTQVIEDAGGIVVFQDFGTRQIDAISEWAPGSSPLFFVNTHGNIPWDRIRLTLAHELAHITMHRSPNPEMEKEANLFAAEFLMPRREIKASLYGLNMAKLQDLKRQWKVSMQALIERAFELQTINDYQRRLFYLNLNKRGHSRIHEPLENAYEIERPTLLKKLIDTHLEGLDYSHDDLANLLMMSDSTEYRSFVGIDSGPRLVA